MPADEDYGRRQIQIQPPQNARNANSSPVPIQCPAGCILPQITPSDRFNNDRNTSERSQDRFNTDRVSFTAERAASDRFGSDRVSSDRFSSDRVPSDRYIAKRVSAERFQNDRTTFGTDRGSSERFNTFTSADRNTSDRYGSNDRFGSERSSSDRLPSGERYQGVSERYPLGERPQTSVSSERLGGKEILQTSGHCQSDRQNIQPERYNYSDRTNTTCQRYPERYTPVQNVGSLDRYHTHATLDRYSRTSTPTDRFHTLSTTSTPTTDKERSHSSSSEPYSQTKDVASTNFDVTDVSRSNDRYTPTERSRNGSKNEVYKVRERSGDRYQYSSRFHEEFQARFHENTRFPTIPCPERFASQDRIQYAQNMQYLEPPSPAPASDRFIPPPPLSPENTPSPDCFPNNSFPSPTPHVPQNDRFIPPPPLSPSPTENYSPNKLERYEKRYHDRYRTSPNNVERYHKQFFGDRYQNYQQTNVNSNERYQGERYLPANAHQPVERYVPNQQEPYYQPQYFSNGTKFNQNGDPYMRRDLAFHYRLPVPYNANQYQRMRHVGASNRVKCCQYQDGYQLSKSSPGSSSSSSVTSQKDIQCQELCQKFSQEVPTFQLQEKSTQCNAMSPNVRKGCRHSICASPSVEYVGSTGGRHVSATPPPRGSIGSNDGSICSENCCTRRSQTSLAVAVWRTTPPQQHAAPQLHSATNPQQPSHQTTSPPQSSTSTEQKSPQTSNNRSSTPSTKEEPPQTAEPEEKLPQKILQTQNMAQPQNNPQLRPQRAVSMPAHPNPQERTQRAVINYSQSERVPNRPPLNRSMSKKEVIKNYIRKETANFFGVGEENEESRLRWLDRRKRMASRTLGPLKEQYRPTSDRFHRRTLSELPQGETYGQLTTERPDVLPGPSDSPDGQDRLNDVTVRRKESVARMTWDGLSYVVTTLTRNRPRPRPLHQSSRSYPPDTPSTASTPEEQRFFDKPHVSSPRTPEGGDTVDRPHMDLQLQNLRRPEPIDRFNTPPPGGWRREHDDVVLRHGENRPHVGSTRILSSMLDHVLDNSNRRVYGMGWVGRTFGRSMRKSVAQDVKVRQQLDDMEDHRPMFTYWVTIVQILVLFTSLVCYGFGPFGIDMQGRSGQVMVTSLSLQQVEYLEPANFWFGPSAADLIHLGAKFGPCMRVDDKVTQQIDKLRAKERDTGCCIRNDDSGCVQSTQSDCSKTISTWKKFTGTEIDSGGRISGPVCGLDPKFCDAPASVHPFEWSDDITKWPICRKHNTQFSIQKKSRAKLAEHMVCEVIAHPCCIGIHGQCKITTKEYCDFVKGGFHEEASLCSQVSCLNDVCGMLPFYFPDSPDQFYRLWTSLFLHAGVLQLAVTLAIQWFLMRDLEKLTGSLRIAIIYIGSGMAGNLASAIFVPYRADVGPAGSQFGLLACLIVEVLNAWPMLKHPNKALLKLLTITCGLFLIGLLPWVDNYAHLFGFVFGFFLSYAMMPFISFGRYDKQKKILLIWVCFISAGILFICLILLFYIIPVYDCKICSYFNCIPFTDDFCASQNINFKRDDV